MLSRWNGRIWPSLLGLAVLAGSGVAASLEDFPPVKKKVAFVRDIAPILARCADCHGAKKQESGLRLDSLADILRGGEHGAAVVPGKSADSLMVLAVAGLHAEVARMPKKGEPLTATDIGMLRAWIDQGALWPESPKREAAGKADHWAFQPVKRPAVPRVKGMDSKASSPVDRFVAASLAKEGLKFAPEADRATLLRRAALDLTGLPPSPEEVDAFVADRSADAYARAVDRLLASPHHGEKWARWWLDAARYADSNGFEKDRTRSIWPWRDWVIRSFNADLPFDRFTVEQLAGDLLPGSTLDQRIATGYLRNSMINMEGGIEPEKFRTETIIDRVDAVGRTWLGLTIACAQCHSHKYDPISQAEYYGFYAFLNQDDEPRLEVPNAGQAAKREDIVAKSRALEDRLMADPAVAGRMTEWLAGLKAPEAANAGRAKSPDEPDAPASANSNGSAGAVALPQTDSLGRAWRVIDAKEWHSTPMKYEKQEDGSLLGNGDVYNSGILRIWADVTTTHITGLRLEALNDGNLPFRGPGIDQNGDFLVTEFTVEATPLSELASPDAGATNFVATTNRIVFRRAAADVEPVGFGAALMIDGVTTNATGWSSAQGPGRRNQERRAVFEAAQPFGFPGGTRLLISVNCKPPGGLSVPGGKVSNYLIGRARLSLTTEPGEIRADPLSSRQAALLALAPERRTPEQVRELFRVFLFQDPKLEGAAKEWDALWDPWPKAENTTLALDRRPVARRTRLFKRGDWTRPTTEVSARVPAVLNPLPSGATPDRLGLANWIVDPRNPLTARVIVNRVWLQYFGQGLVTTPEDFGTRAERPSHPELLDWLASEFVAPSEPGVPPWSLKHLHRLIVLSSTYRQGSRVTPALLEKDPYNRLLARGPRYRFDAETIQDAALKAAGILSPKIGGPSVFPVLPDGVMQLAYGPIAWNVSEGEDRYRRAMYTFWKRSVPFPAMLMFDAPTSEQSCVRRMRSNTPLQALVTLNEPTLNNAARWLGWNTLWHGGAEETARASYLFRQVLGRRPEPAESSALIRLLADAKGEFVSKPRDAGAFGLVDPKNPPPLPPGTTVTDVAAWTTVARAVLNLDEAITKE
jgi:Protein of unknown function (DUF1549)/Protein of unknown function (DUF1553)/Planctomycete cytochrome C